MQLLKIFPKRGKKRHKATLLIISNISEIIFGNSINFIVFKTIIRLTMATKLYKYKAKKKKHK